MPESVLVTITLESNDTGAWSAYLRVSGLPPLALTAPVKTKERAAEALIDALVRQRFYPDESGKV
jgi:hypothetical protein